MPLTADEAEYLLKEAIEEEQRRLQIRLRPYIEALVEIEGRKPPHPVELPDGRRFVYRGPTTEDMAGPYKAPNWLEGLCRDDVRFADALRRYWRESL